MLPQCERAGVHEALPALRGLLPLVARFAKEYNKIFIEAANYAGRVPPAAGRYFSGIHFVNCPDYCR